MVTVNCSFNAPLFACDCLFSVLNWFTVDKFPSFSSKFPQLNQQITTQSFVKITAQCSLYRVSKNSGHWYNYSQFKFHTVIFYYYDNFTQKVSITCFYKRTKSHASPNLTSIQHQFVAFCSLVALAFSYICGDCFLGVGFISTLNFSFIHHNLTWILPKIISFIFRSTDQQNTFKFFWQSVPQSVALIPDTQLT